MSETQGGIQRSGIQRIGIVGAGAMGRGIAQIAAQAGLRVRLFDLNAQAAAAARQALDETWRMLAKRGKLTDAQAAASLERVAIHAALTDLSDCDLVVEAIVEKLEVKQSLMRQLEDIVAPDCILASNTSSLSITAIAAACAHPARVAGYHFFNPVPLMKVVEVIDGLRTDPAVGDALMALAARMGHAAVRARDMPGFIVNHAGRGMNIEGLKLAQESVAPFRSVDAIMREQAGFRMGPFELMDLTALDVSHPVMEAIYRQFYDEPRFRPSPITAVRLAGGLLGRKTQQGFYSYQDGRKQEADDVPAPALSGRPRVWVAPWHPLGNHRAEGLLRTLPVALSDTDAPGEDELIVVTPYGEDVATLVARHGLPAERTVGLDTLFGLEAGRRRVVMVSAATAPEWRDVAHAVLASDGTPVTVIQDSAGFVGQRMVATIINVACDIAQQGIASPADIDLAVSLGLGYPNGGPLSLGDALGAAAILEILQAAQRVTGDMRYRPSLWLQRRVQLGLPLVAQPRCQ